MSGDSNEEGNVVTEPESNEAAETALTLETLQTEISKVISINKELIASRDAAKTKLREVETAAEQAQEQRQGVEGELDAMEQKFQAKLDDVLIDAALDKELSIAGARNVELAKKLLDKQNIKVVNGKADISVIQSSIEQLKENESYMFLGEAEITPLKPTATPVARAGEPDNENVVHKELRAATSIKDLKAIIEKHNIKN